MDQEITDKLLSSLSDTKIDLIDPDKDELSAVLSLKSHQLSTLNEESLTKYIYSLSQYLIYLQVQSNVRNVKFLEAKRCFEIELYKEMNKFEAKTVKEKENMALLSSEHLQKLEKDMRIKSADYKLFEKLPDHISELINAFKKELSNRQSHSQYRGR